MPGYSEVQVAGDIMLCKILFNERRINGRTVIELITDKTSSGLQQWLTDKKIVEREPEIEFDGVRRQKSLFAGNQSFKYGTFFFQFFLQFYPLVIAQHPEVL